MEPIHSGTTLERILRTGLLTLLVLGSAGYFLWDGYVAYPLGLNGVVVGQGETSQAALADVKSAIRFHIQSFGQEILDGQSPVLEAYVTEADIQV